VVPGVRRQADRRDRKRSGVIPRLRNRRRRRRRRHNFCEPPDCRLLSPSRPAPAPSHTWPQSRVPLFLVDQRLGPRIGTISSQPRRRRCSRRRATLSPQPSPPA
jgi:hypothetical protein